MWQCAIINVRMYHYQRANVPYSMCQLAIFNVRKCQFSMIYMSYHFSYHLCSSIYHNTDMICHTTCTYALNVILKHCICRLSALISAHSNADGWNLIKFSGTLFTLFPLIIKLCVPAWRTSIVVCRTPFRARPPSYFTVTIIYICWKILNFNKLIHIYIHFPSVLDYSTVSLLGSLLGSYHKVL